MEYLHNKDLVMKAKELRKNLTTEERHLWYDFLRVHPAKVVRQKVFGNYIVDFYCAAAKLVIEVDGSQHYKAAGEQYDMKRTAYLEGYGLTVVRIPNNAVSGNFDGVCEYLDGLLRKTNEE